MKTKLKIILMILIGAIIFSCSTEYKIIHKELSIPDQCLFEKFTEIEKDSMVESVGRKIYRNQLNCEIRQKRINDIIFIHNEVHKR